MLLYLLVLPGMLYVVTSFKTNVGGMDVSTGGFFTFPDVWHYTAYVSSYFHFLLGLVVINLITSEYTHRTLRQQVIDGLSRGEVLGSKLSMIALLCVAATFHTAICALIMGFIKSVDIGSGEMFSQIKWLGNFMLQGFGYMCLAAMIGWLIRRTGLSYVLFLIAGVIEAIALRLLPPVFSEYAPITMINDILPRPFNDDLEGFGVELTQTPVSFAIALGSFYILLFIGFSYWRIKRSDL